VKPENRLYGAETHAPLQEQARASDLALEIEAARGQEERCAGSVLRPSGRDGVQG
jgi:hypothetical protein